MTATRSPAADPSTPASNRPKMMHDEIVTVQQHINEQQREHPEATGEFSWLLSGITLATKIISSYVRRAGLLDFEGATGDVNVQGETVQKLDMIAHETLMRTLGYRHNVGIIASEEDADPRVLREVGRGKYVIMFDPLDGSSNIDCNVPVGTIFTILRNQDGDTNTSVCQSGLQQVAAGYVVYGPATVLVYTTGEGVHLFTLDPAIGAFVLVKENLRMPEQGTDYSVNEGNAKTFPESYQKYIDWTKTPDAGPLSLRYCGSLVSDFHRILLKGGVFLYPPTQKNPGGKLRLMYEANPLALIAEQAGGLALDGAGRILEKQPTSLHERTPLIIGSRKQVQKVTEFVTT